MKKYRIASILIIIHEVFLEIGGCLCLLPFLLTDGPPFSAGQYFSFIVPYFNGNMGLMLVMGVIYGVMRVIGAVGLWKNRMWGLALSVINCVLTMALMMFMLPAGIADGLLSCTALVLILTQYFGDRRITPGP